jgi:hypothetical protein
MTTQGKNYPPRIISFRTNLQGVAIAGQQHILWPCHAFKISVPTRRQNSLNIFEETVLRLCSTEKGDPANLANLTCLDVDIIKFIQARLVQLDLLTERFELTEKAVQLIDQRQKGDESFQAATAYLDLVGGNLLPVVSSKPHRYLDPTEKGRDYVQFSFGTVGQTRSITARKLLPDPAFLGEIPTSKEVYRTIKSFKRLQNRFYLLTGNAVDFAPIDLGSEAITIHEEGELVFLHCKAIVQQGNPDYLVSDPFGYGFSSSFKDTLSQRASSDQHLNTWLIKLKERGVIDQLADPTARQHASELPQGFSKSLLQYPEIKYRVTNAERKYWELTALNAVTTSQAAERDSLVQDCYKILYDALEWTLRQVLFENRVDDWEQVFTCQSYQENNQLLQQMATRIGLVVPGNASILQVSQGKFRALASGMVEMQPLLALVIAGAIQDNQHPMHRLAASNRNSLAFIVELKGLRDASTHGAAVTRLSDNTEVEYYREGTYQIIKSLYPLLRSFGSGVNDMPAPDLDSIDQARLKARIRLDSYFGVSLVQMMPQALVSELSRIELWDETGLELAGYVNSLASALQNALFAAASEFRGRLIDKSDATCLAGEKAVTANFSLINDTLPGNLIRSNRTRVKQACSGSNISLGTNLIAFLALLPAERLQHIANRVPKLIFVVDRLVGLRGHGNKPSLQIEGELKENEIKLLKESTFLTIKLLMEEML